MKKEQYGLIIVFVVLVTFGVLYFASIQKNDPIPEPPATLEEGAHTLPEEKGPNAINTKNTAATLKQGRKISGSILMKGGPSVGQTGTFTITELEGLKTRVQVTLANFTSGLYQPAHVHLKRCADVEGIVWNLNTVVNGKSDTLLNVYFDDVVRSHAPHSIVVHKSASEFATLTACGDIL